jgi:hypothetical protein
MDLFRVALIWAGAKIAALISLLEGLGWAVLNGTLTGGSDIWDDLANYDMLDRTHLAKVLFPAIGVSLGQYWRSQSQLRELRLQHEIDLIKVQAGIKDEPAHG